MTVRRTSPIFYGATGIILVLVLWEAASRSGLVSPHALPAPIDAVITAIRTVPTNDLLQDFAVSLGRVTAGFAIGATLGVVIGIGAGWYWWFGALLRPIIELIRPIPPLAWIPMAIIWFGLDETSKVFVIVLGAFFPVVTNAYKGMLGIEPAILRAAQTMDVRGVKLLVQVALPAAMPDIATGLRIGWGLSFGILVAAELIAANSGLGYLIMHAQELDEVSVIIFGILAIGVANLATDFFIGWAIKRTVGRWHAV
jgi:NitT/TauT family transport system permease protein